MEEQESFTIKDKRRFKDETEEGGKKAKDEGESPDTKPQEHSHEKYQHTPPAQINFASFIFSLGRSAFMHLGEEPDPVKAEKIVSLPMAKETIDIISLLEEKTRGNLSQDEEQLIKNILYALRMKYVEMASRGPKG